MQKIRKLVILQVVVEHLLFLVKIDDKTSYPVIDYARFLDPDKTDYDMVITFDPSQNCVELWCKNQGTIFVEPPLLAAVQERISELNF